MMIDRRTLSSVFGPDRSEVFECRRCGAAVESATESCPYCGPDTDIVRYEIP